MGNNDLTDKIRIGKALLNSLLVLALSFGLFMIPALVKAFRMGFELGPQSDDPNAVSRTISDSISEMYQNSALLITGLILITILIIFWRARAVSKGTGNKRMINGLLVASLPVILSIFWIGGEVGLSDIAVPLLYLGAGIAGGVSNK